MGTCCSIPKPATHAAPESPAIEHLEQVSAVQNGHASLHDLQTTDQQTKPQPDAILPEHDPQDSIIQWRQEHQLQQQIILQSQEIAKLRKQVIDLQAYRQQQQKQHQRAAYMKSQILSGSSHKLQIPQDCCCAAVACCIAVEEMKADLKVEGKLICKRLDTLSH